MWQLVRNLLKSRGRRIKAQDLKHLQQALETHRDWARYEGQMLSFLQQPEVIPKRGVEDGEILSSLTVDWKVLQHDLTAAVAQTIVMFNHHSMDVA